MLPLTMTEENNAFKSKINTPLEGCLIDMD